MLAYCARPFLLLLALCLFNTSVFAQSEITISGNVLDGNGEPVIGASVIVKGTTKGVITDVDGNYTISAAPNATLVYSFVGFNPVEESVENRTKINVAMFEGQEMDEVVVVGYGTVKRANMLGSVASMTTNDIQDIPTANLSTALEGRLAGVKISQSSGKPGASTSLQIRESSSYGSAENPLFVIDGIIRDQEAFDALDPSEVESISILKDASAAVYGARAAGGVVLVQTKRGKEGKVKVSYNGTAGFTQAINVPEMLSAYEHAKMMNDSYDIRGIRPSSDAYYSDDELAYFKDSLPGGGYDWLDEAWKMAMVTKHSLNMSGGTKSARYFIGGSYHYETGSLEGLDVSKYSLRSSLDLDLFKGLT
ncbi:MAG: SusC/RagA family TonB-linked outer membrane protein, partial [Prevotellaceae bacterium]|nr:SusC/RagA family TonB-linked outer membrane protein [Prevotellaceae bacterium]